jgi:hypothetical protein
MYSQIYMLENPWDDNDVNALEVIVENIQESVFSSSDCGCWYKISSDRTFNDVQVSSMFDNLYMISFYGLNSEFNQPLGKSSEPNMQ